MSSERSFETEIQIDAPRASVWKALVDPQELTRWFPNRAVVRPGVGGEVTWSWDGHCDWKQTIEVWEEEARLRTRYDSPVDDGKGGKQPLFVDFRLEGDTGSTTLRLVQSGFGPEAAFDHEYDGISRGWPLELRSLRHYLENHRGKDRQLIRATPSIPGDLDEFWSRLTGEGGLGCGEGVATLNEGAPFSIAFPDGVSIDGTALRCTRHELSGIIPSLGDAFLRVSLEDNSSEPCVWLWMALYGRAKSEVAAWTKRWETFLNQLVQGGTLESRASS